MPYSSVYSALIVSAGSLPGLRAGTNPAPSSRARAAPRMKPRASAATTKSTWAAATRSARPLTAASSAPASSSSGVMSRNRIPGRGKSGMSRMNSRRSRVGTLSGATASGRDLAQVADEEQMLEVGGDRGEILQRIDRLLAPLGITRAQRRGQDVLEQLRLAVGRAAEHPQVAATHAVARELGYGPDDLALGLVVVLDPGAVLALDDAELDELTHELGRGAGVLHHVVEREQRPRVAHPDSGPAR